METLTHLQLPSYIHTGSDRDCVSCWIIFHRPLLVSTISAVELLLPLNMQLSFKVQNQSLLSYNQSPTSNNWGHFDVTLISGKSIGEIFG